MKKITVKKKKKKKTVLLILDTMLDARDRKINSNFIAKVHTKLATLVKTISRVSHFYFLEVFIVSTLKHNSVHN